MLKKIRTAYVEWWARRLPDCDTTTRKISDAMDRQLSFTERLQIRLHNHICEWCARYARQLLLMRETLHERTGRETAGTSSTPGASLSAEARERMKRKLSRAE